MTMYFDLGIAATMRLTGERVIYNAIRWCEEHQALEVRIVSRQRVAWVKASEIQRRPRR